MVFHRSLSDSKSPQVFRTPLSNLAVLNHAAIWMLSTSPPTSNSSSPFNNPLVTVPKALITIGIIVTMPHSFFHSLASSRYLSFFFFTNLQLYSVISRESKVDNFANSLFFFFFLIIIKSGLLAEIRWSVCMSKSHRSLCVSFYYYYCYYYSLGVFHINISWRSFTGVWVTASLL